MASTSEVVVKPVVFKFQGVPPKSMLHDDYTQIKDTNLGHMNLGEFMRVCNNPIESSTMMSALICSRLVNATSHPRTIQ